MKKIDAHANILFNGVFYCIETMSLGMLAYTEPEATPHYLPPDVEDEILGRTLREALNASKTVSIEEFQKIFHSGVIQQLGNERNAWAMKNYGYKNKRAMYRKMDCCWISAADGQIEIKPTRHKGLDAYSGISNDGPEIQYVSVAISDADLGAALKEGFKRCTGSPK
ncbi:contact-dependent growth inhibition system immunity protein [Azonexus sp. IMCC34839]|uniref:contact-dependent growth inhibition system immunity protein n=1 Tax=Azonexus sp. IMCC34839 TaxID=3133695 RepID=UPI00399B2AD7